MVGWKRFQQKNKCSECPHKQKCDEVEAIDKDEQIDLCGATIKALAIDTVEELAEEYKNGHFGCNSNGEHEKCRNCELDCKQRNQIWFGIKEECINTSTDTSSSWIPCSERLPQENEPVDTLCQIVNVMLKNGTVTSGWCNRYLEKWYVLDHHHDYPLPFEYKDIIAWQPLPAPYKEGE